MPASVDVAPGSGSSASAAEAASAAVRDLDLELQRQAVHARLFGTPPTPPLLGRFALLRRVGAGGMGVVYEAYDDRLDRKVALKLLHPQAGGAEATARLLREARAMARLSHPNVAQVHDVGQHQGRVFVAIEFIAGQTLRAWQSAEDRDWRAIVDMYVRTGEGLVAVHEAELVHRDFKPDNVLVSARDGRPRVLDFGLAYEDDDEPASSATRSSPPRPRPAPPGGRLTVTGARLGTPGYAAPELRGGSPATPLADQYSFCAALHEALCGALPGQRDSSDRSENPGAGARADSRRERPTTPPWIEAAIRRGLAPAPADRHPSMRALLEALTRDPRRARRRRLLAGFGLAAGVGLAAALWTARTRATTEQRAQEARVRAAVAEAREADAAAREAGATAQSETARAEARRLSALARARAEDRPIQALLLAVEAVAIHERERLPPLPEAEQGLRDLLDTVRSVPLSAEPRAPVERVAVAPGGLVATADRRGALTLWSAQVDPRPLARALERHAPPSRALGLVFSPGAERLAASFADGSVALWNLPDESVTTRTGPLRADIELSGEALTGAPLLDPALFWSDARPMLLARSGDLAVLIGLPTTSDPAPALHTLRGHEGSVHAARPGPRGQLIATASRDGTARLWRARDGAPLGVLRPATTRTGEPAPALVDLDLDPEGARLVAAGRDGHARVWRLRGARRPQLIQGHGSPLRLARFTDRGSGLVTVAEDGTTRSWELSGAAPRSLPPAHLPELTGTIGPLRHDPVQDLLLGTPTGGAALLWTLTGPGAPLVLRGHTGNVVEARFDARGETLATASADGTARLWRYGAQRDVLRGHAFTVGQAEFTPRGDALLSASMDGTARLWSLAGASAGQARVLGGHREGATVIARVDAAGRRIATASADGALSLWTGDGARVGSLMHLTGDVVDLALADDGRLAIGTREGRVHLVRADAPDAPPRELSIAAAVSRLALTDRGGLLVASEDGRVFTWSNSHQSPRAGPTLAAHAAPIRDLALAEDGRALATAGEDGLVNIFPLDADGLPSGRARALLGHRGPVWSVEFDPDGDRVITASSDRTARIWPVNQGDPTEAATPRALRGHLATVWSARFSPDGALALTTSADGSARLWRLERDVVVVLPHAGTAAPGDRDTNVWSGDFSPDGARVATAAGDGVVRLFPVSVAALIDDACVRAGRPLSEREWREALGERSYDPRCPPT